MSPSMPRSAPGSMTFIRDSSVYSGNAFAGCPLESDERRNFDVLELDCDHGRTFGVHGAVQRACKLFDGSTIASWEPWEHRAKACADVRSPKRVVARVFLQKKLLAH